MGGRLRLRYQPLPPDTVRGIFPTCSAIEPGGSYVKPEFEMHTPSTFKPDRVASDAMKKAVAGLVMSVGEVEDSFRLNRSDIDHVVVTAALASQTDTNAQQIARLVRETRPRAVTSETSRLERSVP